MTLLTPAMKIGTDKRRRRAVACGSALVACVALSYPPAAAAGSPPAPAAVPQTQAVPDLTAQAPTPTVQTPAADDPITSYFTHWFDRVDAAQASQPHWMTPMATVTPRLEEEFRFDTNWAHQGNDGSLTTIDGGKGLELIPTETNEVLINLPPLDQQNNVKKPVTGLGDWSFLTVKQRLLSANEENGNYIVTAFLGVQAPTGDTAFTNNAWVVTPTIGGGKGWGDFDIQATAGAQIPLAHQGIIGTAVLTNATFQYHVGEHFWPELEVNDTYWSGGERSGKNQIFLTPGLIFGRFPLAGRARLSVGVAYQFAITPEQTFDPLTPTMNHAWIASARVSF